MTVKLNGFFIALLAALCSLGAETITASGGLELNFADRYADQREASIFWKDSDAMLGRFFNASGAGRKCRIYLDDRKPMSLTISGTDSGATEITLDGSIAEWKNNPTVQRRILGAILLAKLGAAHDNAYMLPGWLNSALNSVRESKGGGIRQPVRRNRYYPGLRFLLSNDAVTPPEAVVRLEPDRMPQEVRSAAQDICRFYMELFFSLAPNGRVLRDYITAERLMTQEQCYRSVLLPALSEAARREIAENAADDSTWTESERIEYMVRCSAERAAFNSSFRYPAFLAKERFRRWRQVTLKAEDGKTAPRVIDVSELPRAGLEENEYVLAGLRKQKELLILQDGMPEESRDDLKTMSETLGSIRECGSWFGPRRLRGILERIEKSIDERAAMEEWTGKVAAETYPASLFLRDELRIASEAANAPVLSAAAAAFVDAAEKRYIDGN